VPCKATIPNIVTNTFYWIGAGQKEIPKRRALTEEKCDNIGIQLEANLNKSLRLLTLQCGLATSIAHADTELKLRPYKATAVHGLLPPDCEERIRHCRWCQESVFNGLTDPELIFYSEEAWFNWSSYVNSQNNRYWSTENPHAVCEVYCMI
jgi:hypothetical protein